MASFQKVPTGWRVQLDVQGQRASIVRPTKREAQEWANDKERELRALAAGDLGHGKTLKDALDRYADEVAPKHRGERWEITRLVAYQHKEHGLPVKKLITHVTDDDLRAWRDRRIKVCSRGTVLRDIALLSSVFEHARLEWKWVKANPLKDVTKPSKPAHRRRTITGPEIRSILRALGYTLGPARNVSQSVAVCFLLALATGMRAGELTGLRWADMRELYGTAHNVKAIERGVSRDVPMSPVALRLVERMRGWDEDLVFGVSSRTLDTLFRRARAKAGLNGFTFHDARHSAATRMAGKLHVLELCKVFGWTNTTMALTYYNPTPQMLAKKLAG